MALLISQIGAAPPPPPRRWIYSGLHGAPYEEVEEPIHALATGWHHVTPVPTGRWIYARSPVANISDTDELVRVSTGAVWHVSPSVRRVSPRVVPWWVETDEWISFGVSHAPARVPLPPAPVGTVPIRYVVGETANVVPVETVTVYEAGVVRCREFVGPANVVPVRETTTEVPRVKIIKV